MKCKLKAAELNFYPSRYLRKPHFPHLENGENMAASQGCCKGWKTRSVDEAVKLRGATPRQGQAVAFSFRASFCRLTPSRPPDEAVQAKPCVCQHIPRWKCLTWPSARWNPANSMKAKPHSEDLGISKQATALFVFSGFQPAS